MNDRVPRGLTANPGAREARAGKSMDDLRREIFERLYRDSAPRIMPWIVLTHIFVVCLHLRDHAYTRALVQALFSVMHIVGLRMQASRAKETSVSRNGLLLIVVAYLVSVFNTGGLSSPMLILGIPTLVASSTHPRLVSQRKPVLALVLIALVVVALLSHTLFGTAPSILRSGGMYEPWIHVGFTLSMAAMAAIMTYSIGGNLSRVYESVIVELLDRREELYHETEDRTRALEGVAARLAHEVKNPLTAIRALSTHVARSTTDEKSAERLGIVSAEAERLQAIVDGFLSFSRGLDDLRIGTVRPFEVAESLLALLERRSHDVQVALSVRGDRELQLQADGRKIRQLLLNLVLNAMQASAKGSEVVIEIARLPDGGAFIKVKDHGSGMSKEIVDRIRRPYFTTREGGSGIGVAVARGLVEQHGGTLVYESEVGRGTTVSMTLPKAVAMEGAGRRLPRFNTLDERHSGLGEAGLGEAGLGEAGAASSAAQHA